MTLFLMTLHICAAVVTAILWKRKKLHFSPVMLPIVFFLPLWGPVCAAAVELHFRGGEKADEDPQTGRFGITDEVYRSIRMTEDDVSEILPIEDVLEWGTPVQRRSLLLSVLHTGADPFVRPLRVAGVNDDTEVVHYAVTALVELRSSFAQRIAAMEKRLRERPGDMGTLLASADLDEEYLQSGIPEDTERAELLAHCRGTLEKILQNLAWQETAASGLSPDVSRAGNRRGVSPDTPGRFSAAVRKSSVLRRLGRIYLQQKDAAAAERIGRLLIDASPDLEDGYMFLLDAKVLSRDGQGVRQVIETLRKRGIYLTPAARERLAFWEA